jgi:hypothetical protein
VDGADVHIFLRGRSGRLDGFCVHFVVRLMGANKLHVDDLQPVRNGHAMVVSLLQSAKLNRHDPWAYLKDVLERLLTHPNNRIGELLPHRWSTAG